MNATIIGSAPPDCLKITVTRELGTDNGSWSADWSADATTTMTFDELAEKSAMLAEKLAHDRGLLAADEHIVRHKRGTVTRWDVALIAGAAILACVIIGKLAR